MKRLLIAGVVVAVALAAGIAIAIAATGGGGGGNGAGSAGSSASSAATTTVSAKQIGGVGSVLVDSKGMPLYANDQETSGKVLCNGACLSIWMPLTVKGAPTSGSLSGKLAVVKRPDGEKQVAYNGKLLYTFYLDQPGKVEGNGADDAFGGHKFTWHVVQGNGAVGSSGSSQSSGSRYPGY